MRSLCFSSSDAVDHLLHLVELMRGQILPLCERGNKGGQRAFKFLFDQLVDLAGLRLVFQPSCSRHSFASCAAVTGSCFHKIRQKRYSPS